MSRQSSTKMAVVIFEHFVAIYDGAEPTTEQVLESPFDTLRGIDNSNVKVHYVQNATPFCIDKKNTDTKLKKCLLKPL